jgi:hypothetical protein
MNQVVSIGEAISQGALVVVLLRWLMAAGFVAGGGGMGGADAKTNRLGP